MAQIVKEYLRFHLLRALVTDDKMCIPSVMLKFLWDIHIQETKAYRSFCFDAFGMFVPSLHLPEAISDEIIQNYKLTLALYAEVY